MVEGTCTVGNAWVGGGDDEDDALGVDSEGCDTGTLGADSVDSVDAVDIGDTEKVSIRADVDAAAGAAAGAVTTDLGGDVDTLRAETMIGVVVGIIAGVVGHTIRVPIGNLSLVGS